MVRNFDRGSEWRPWDLQVHTPFSALNQQFGANFEQYAKALLEYASENSLAAIGVTDYFTIQGYRSLRELVASKSRLEALVDADVAQHARDLLLVPNVEFRLSVLVNSRRVNLHVLFDPNVPSDRIESDFLGQLNFTYDSAAGFSDDLRSLNVANLESLGQQLKAQEESFRDHTDLFVGMMNATVAHEHISEVLSKHKSLFAERFVIAIPCDEDLARLSWKGQGHLVRKSLIKKSHILFSGNASTRKFGLGKLHTSVEAFVEEFAGLKPTFRSSDAHKPEDFRRKAWTWVKGDPTFLGLLHALREPESRVSVDCVPSELIAYRERESRTIDRFTAKKVAETTPGRWVESELPLNPGLVVVVGNRGSGKSALLDSMALAGGTRKSDYFSFLKTSRFRKLESKSSKASCFEAWLSWADGSESQRILLSEDPSGDTRERLRFIPQDYFENICNTLESGPGTPFYDEIQAVIFSHVAVEDRLGKTSLHDLIDHQTAATQEGLAAIRASLHAINQKLESAEKLTSPATRGQLAKQVWEKRREVSAHMQREPKFASAPSDAGDTGAAVSAAENVAKLRDELDKLDSELAQAQAKVGESVTALSQAETLDERLRNLDRKLEESVVSIDALAQELSLTTSSLISWKINRGAVKTKISSLQEVRDTARAQQDEEQEDTSAARRKKLLANLKSAQARLDEPQRLLEEHRTELRIWKETLDSLVGSSDNPESLEGLRARVRVVQEAPRRAESLRTDREKKTREIMKAIVALQERLASYFQPVHEDLQRSPLGSSLVFQVGLRDTGFVEHLTRMIDGRKAGPFSTRNGGADALARLIAPADLSSENDLIALARSVADGDEAVEGAVSQLLANCTRCQLYDYLFGLEYIEPRYTISWSGKPLERLSPGERGHLLLVFYLLADNDPRPLIIDQPEGNLDSETVYNTLVPCLREARARRQIIIASHNPNIAVVTSADQIIHASMDKSGASMTFDGGSVENPCINQRLVKVLEGTWPAFRTRESHYQKVDSSPPNIENRRPEPPQGQ